MPVEYAITVRQPWSQIIAEAEALKVLGVEPKLVENRGRAVAAKYIGTDIAIHAGKTWDDDGARDPIVQRAWKVFDDAIGLREPNPLLAAIGDTRTGYVGPLRPGMWCEMGAIVAVATFTGSHAAETPTCCEPWGWPLHYNGKRAWHLTFANVRRLDRVIPASGKQAVPWRLPPAIVSDLGAALVASS